MADTTKLVDDGGNVRVGVFDEPVFEINYRDYRLTNPFGSPAGRLRKHFTFNQFQFLGALSEDLVFGCALADVKYVGTAFLYFYEPSSGRYAEFSFKTPLALGTRFDQAPESGVASFRIGRNRIEMTGSTRPRERRLRVDLARGVSVDACFSEERPPMQPMFICTQTGATGWVFARKTAGLGVSGTVLWEGRRYDLAGIGAAGHHDWSAGYMRRETFWNWGCLAGPLGDGRVAGMNVSCGVNETSFTENCFWVDGRRHKIDTVFFDYDRFDLDKPWRLTSSDDRLRLEFQPEGKHVEKINAWIVASDFNQLFGRYHGWLRTEEGEKVVIDDMLGYMERHYAKW